MNEFVRAARYALAAIALSSCSPNASGSTEAPPLAGATIGGPFQLIDQDGKPVSDRDFAGRYRIMYFGYTFCPDVCPTDMQNLGAAMRQLDKTDPKLSTRITPIFVSVDPARDTPAVLKPFVSAFYPRLVGLTGSASAIAATAKEYRVFYQRQPATPGGSYIVQHSDQAILFGPDGKPLAIVPVSESPQAIVATLERWA
ncbi:MAG: SCO family protein [Sphingomonas sp.]